MKKTVEEIKSDDQGPISISVVLLTSKIFRFFHFFHSYLNLRIISINNFLNYHARRFRFSI